MDTVLILYNEPMVDSDKAERGGNCRGEMGSIHNSQFVIVGTSHLGRIPTMGHIHRDVACGVSFLFRAASLFCIKIPRLPDNNEKEFKLKINDLFWISLC